MLGSTKSGNSASCLSGLGLSDSDKMAAEKRFTRGANYTPDEESKILDCVDRHRDIIECKKNDGVTWTAKKRAWQIITKEYNSGEKRPRGEKELQLKYKCLKKAAKKYASQKLESSCGTNGGRYEPPYKTSIHDRVLKHISPAATRLPSVTESDNHAEEEKSEAENSESDEVGSFDDEFQDIELMLPVFEAAPGRSREQPAAVIAERTSISDDRSPDTSTILRRPMHSVLTAATSYTGLRKDPETLPSNGSTSNGSQHRSVPKPQEALSLAGTSQYSPLAVARTELVKMQKDLLVTEYQDNEERQAKEHELRMKIMNADLKLHETRMLNERADLQIKLLKIKAMKKNSMYQ